MRTVSNPSGVSALPHHSEANRNNPPMRLWVRGGLQPCSLRQRLPENCVKGLFYAGDCKRTVRSAKSSRIFSRTTLRGPNILVVLFAPTTKVDVLISPVSPPVSLEPSANGERETDVGECWVHRRDQEHLLAGWSPRSTPPIATPGVEAPDAGSS